MGNTYVVDTSALIDLHKWYPDHTFPSVWERLEKLSKEDRIAAPRMVKKEIHERNEFLHNWRAEHEKMFREDESLMEALKTITKKYPYYEMIRYRDHADPFVAALAMQMGGLMGPVIITQEKKAKFASRDRAAGGSQQNPDCRRAMKRPKIPDVADRFEIEWDDLFGLFRREELVF